MSKQQEKLRWDFNSIALFVVPALAFALVATVTAYLIHRYKQEDFQRTQQEIATRTLCLAYQQWRMETDYATIMRDVHQLCKNRVRVDPPNQED